MDIIKILQLTNVGEGVEKREPSYTAGGNINWCSHYGKQYVGSSKKLKIETSLVVQWLRIHLAMQGTQARSLVQEDPTCWEAAEPVLQLESLVPHKEDPTLQNDACTPVFIAALPTTAKTWKKPKCPSTDEWVKMWCTHTHTHTHTQRSIDIME